MKKNFKNLGLILGMVAMTSFTMTSCAEATEDVKTEGEAKTPETETTPEVAPEADATKCGAETDAAKCGAETDAAKCGDAEVPAEVPAEEAH